MRAEYLGMSQEQVSREAMRLINAADVTENWLSIIDRLVDLRLAFYAASRAENAREHWTTELARAAGDD